MNAALLEYFNASVAFNNSHGDGPEGESLSEAVERSNKAEARFDAATQAAHAAIRALAANTSASQNSKESK